METDEKKIRKGPIYPEEIERYRRSLRVGKTVRIKDTEKIRKFQILEKYPYFCRLEDEEKKKTSLQYVQMYIGMEPSGLT